MNNILKFRETLKSNDFTIPFKLEESALLNWLMELNHHDAKEACIQTLYLLQALNKTELIAKNRIEFLLLIIEYLKQYINRLEGACWDAGFPLTIEENVYAEMVAWNYLALGEAFFTTADRANKKTDAVFSIAMALHSIGQAQLHIAAVYSIPPKGFWHLLYQVFAWAEKRKLQQLKIDREPLKDLTINTLFAKSLIFQVCDTSQFRPRDMRTIFNFLDRVCVNLPIDPFSSEVHGLFMLDLKTDSHPVNIKTQSKLAGDLTRYYSPITVANNLEKILEKGDIWTGTLKSINEALFSRVVKTLGLKQKRLYSRKSENHSLLGVIGFEEITGFLYKATKTPVIQTQQTPPAETPKETGLKIYMDDFRFGRTTIGKAENYNLEQKLSTTNQQIWEQNKTTADISVKKISLKKVKVLDSSANGYSVSWDQSDTRAKIGDLLGIISGDKKRLEIAIIRRIALNSGNDFTNDFRFGAELLGFESELVYLVHTKNSNIVTWAVFIPGIELLEQTDALIYPVGHFKIGDKFYMHRYSKTSLSLVVKELHSTAAISHVEISYPETEH
jgi:hypothetical protein